MSSLSDIDKRYLERLLGMGSGYVIDYSDATFSEFFRRHAVDIHGAGYTTYGTSKAKKMRAFWGRKPDELVGKVLAEMLDSYVAICELDGKNSEDATPSFGEWLTASVRVLELGDVRDESFKKLVSQYHKLTTTLDDLRNKAGNTSHVKDGFIAKLSALQRRAAVLIADTIVTFLHKAYLEREPDPVLTLEPFGRFAKGNALIDAHSLLVAEADEEGGLLVTVTLPNKEEIPLAISPAQLLFGVDREAYKLALKSCRKAEPEEEEAA